jgi:two-component system response regulator AtoC
LSTLTRAVYKHLSDGLPPDPVVFGTTATMQEIRLEIERLAGTDLPILIEGESGTGKDILARWIHAHSPRRADPFIKVHCPAGPPMLLESELFGYEQGTLVEALRLKPGQVKMAQSGTLFLDEISEMDIDLQAKFLQLLQDGHFTRLGGGKPHRVEARFICSTFRSLAELAEQGEFRKDLLYRINAVHLRLPPLRMRSGDIPALADYMLEACSLKYQVPVRPLSGELLNLLQACAWPGNIRQLENLIRRYVVLGCEEESISAELLDESCPDLLSTVSEKGPVALKKVVRALVRGKERKIILRALHSHHWNRKETARSLGISYQALLHKMRQDQLSPSPVTAGVISDLREDSGYVN